MASKNTPTTKKPDPSPQEMEEARKRFEADHPHLVTGLTEQDLFDDADKKTRLQKFFMGSLVAPQRKFDDDAAVRCAVFYALTGRKCDSAHAAGVHYTTMRTWEKENKQFAEMMQEAREVFLDTLEREAFRRAVEGELEPVVAGKDPTIVTWKIKKSDKLLEMLLKKHDPVGYGRSEAGPPVNVNVGVLVAPAGTTRETTPLTIEQVPEE